MLPLSIPTAQAVAKPDWGRGAEVGKDESYIAFHAP